MGSFKYDHFGSIKSVSPELTEISVGTKPLSLYLNFASALVMSSNFRFLVWTYVSEKNACNTIDYEIY